MSILCKSKYFEISTFSIMFHSKSETVSSPRPFLLKEKNSCLFPVLSLGVCLTPVHLVLVSRLRIVSSSSLNPREYASHSASFLICSDDKLMPIEMIARPARQ